eukprot:scaffold120965_cov63-Phaeocystis_antarctica.AAC.4
MVACRASGDCLSTTAFGPSASATSSTNPSTVRLRSPTSETRIAIGRTGPLPRMHHGSSS